tara:strand:- start:25 stop:423 length:399 start_codon:yes stop_codon:yes gene_type:complete
MRKANVAVDVAGIVSETLSLRVGSSSTNTYKEVELLAKANGDETMRRYAVLHGDLSYWKVSRGAERINAICAKYIDPFKDVNAELYKKICAESEQDLIKASNHVRDARERVKRHEQKYDLSYSQLIDYGTEN